MDKPQILDISLYQGAIDWPMLAQMRVGVIARIGQDDFIDAKWEQHYGAAVAAGVPIGGYWFYQPNRAPERQVSACLKYINGKKLSVIALDVEDIYIGNGQPNIVPPSATVHSVWLQGWLTAIEAATGVTPGIYTRADYWDKWTVRSSTWQHYWLWIASWYNYTGSNPPRLPLDWSTYKVHQYEGGTGRHPAVVGPVDRNYYNGTTAEMYRFFGATLPEEPPIPAGLEERVKKLEDYLQQWTTFIP